MKYTIDSKGFYTVYQCLGPGYIYRPFRQKCRCRRGQKWGRCYWVRVYFGGCTTV